VLVHLVQHVEGARVTAWSTALRELAALAVVVYGLGRAG